MTGCGTGDKEEGENSGDVSDTRKDALRALESHQSG